VSTLIGKRLVLRPLVVEDFPTWSEVRARCADWLLKWEPMRTAGAPDPSTSRDAFAVRCGARQRERQLGTGYGYGILIDGHVRGEINLSIVQRGPFQSAYVGYWIDEACAGQGYMPEALVVLMRFAFEDLHLHRVQVSIIPRNTASRRVVEKLDLRDEGTAQRYLEINGVWEDHVRYAMTVEEWDQRRDELMAAWVA
jgi:ribosomal-protein-alanine N-acetyltransferase